MKTRRVSDTPPADPMTGYRGVGAPQPKPAATEPLSVPLAPSLRPPDSVRDSALQSYPAQDVLSGTLHRWSGIPADSAYAPWRVNPDVKIAGASETGRLPADKPSALTVTRDGLILYARRTGYYTMPELCSARLDAQGRLIPGGTTAPLSDYGPRAPVQLARTTFLVSGGGELLTIVRDNGGGLAVAHRQPFDGGEMPVVTRDGVVIIQNDYSDLHAFTIDGTNVVHRSASASGGGGVHASNAPFQLPNGHIVSTAKRGTDRTMIITTRVDATGELHPAYHVEMGKFWGCQPGPGNHVVFCEDHTYAITVFRVEADGRFTKVDDVAQRHPVELMTATVDGCGFAGTRSGAFPGTFVPMRFSAQGKLELNMEQKLKSTDLPILTRNGTLITADYNRVTVETLNHDGSRTPRCSNPDVGTWNRVAVMPNGTIIVAADDALVALGAPSAAKA